MFVCPIEILRMAALSIELSHVLFIKSNYLQNGCVICCKTFVPEIQPKLLLRALQAAWQKYDHAYFISVVFIVVVPCVSVVFCHHVHLDPEIYVRTCSPQHGKTFIIVIFAKNAWFRSYDIICLPPMPPTTLKPQTTDTYHRNQLKVGKPLIDSRDFN